MLRKRNILFIIALLAVCVIPALAQYLKPGQEGRSLVYYKKDAQGLYQKHITSNGTLPYEHNIIDVICLDKKNKCLYVATPEGIYELTLDKEQFNQLKKDKSIPQLKKDEVWNAVNAYSNQLDESIESYNTVRKQEIQDSIRKEQARLDSLRHAREKAIADSIARVREQKAREDYRRTHSPYVIKNPGNLKAIYLDDYTIPGDSLYIASITDGKVAFKEYPDEFNVFKGVDFFTVANLNDCIKDRNFAYHYEVFADSLNNKLSDLSFDAASKNVKKALDNQRSVLNKKYPNGFITKFGWNDEYRTISFWLIYDNSTYKTIKYLSVDVNFYNEVNDLCCSGTFNGTGPIGPFEENGWEWDHSLIFTRGDEAYCDIKRITITYTNGKKVVLTGNKIQYSAFCNEED